MRRATLLGLLLVAACVSVSKSVLDPYFQARPFAEEDVLIYGPSDSLPVHVRVAILEAEGDRSYTDRTDLLNSLRKEAGKLGANAIIWGGTEDAGTGARVSEFLFGTPADHSSRAIAIYIPSLDERQDGGR